MIMWFINYNAYRSPGGIKSTVPAAKSNKDEDSPTVDEDSPTVDEDSPTVDSSATTVKLPTDEDNISDITDSLKKQRNKEYLNDQNQRK